MYTRCPQCQAVHPLSAATLAHASGRVRCANCNEVFSALTSLFDDRPRSGQAAPENNVSSIEPVLGSINLPPPSDLPEAEPYPRPRVRRNRWIWGTALALLILVTLTNLAWTFRTGLIDHPGVRKALVRAGWLEAQPDTPYRDVSKIHLVSRDMHQHPTLAGMLALSATFVSRAEQAQPYPAIELTLTDAGNNAVARRAFKPAEYLPGGIIPPAGLTPGVHVPVLLEFADPGSTVTGFSLEFR